jgi:hypothetical protein
VKSFLFAAIAALALSISAGSAFAAMNNGAHAGHQAPIYYDTPGG